MLFEGRIETTMFTNYFLFIYHVLVSVRSHRTLATQPTVYFYHCLFALARERITVAITFIVNTNTNKTNAVPY